MDLIQSITNAVAGEFDFNSIPGGYTRLILTGRLRSTETGAAGVAAYMFYNADTTTTNYHRQWIAGVNNAASNTESSLPFVASVPTDGSPSGSYASLYTVMEGYTSTVYLKSVLSEFESFYNTGEIITGIIGMINPSITAAITRLRIRTANHPTYGLVGYVKLYGEP